MAQHSDCASASSDPVTFSDPTQNSCNQWKSDAINISTATVASSFPNGTCTGGTAIHNYWISFIMPPNSSTSFSIQYSILGSCTPADLTGLSTSVFTGTCGALTNISRQCSFCNTTTCNRRTFTNAQFTPGRQIFLQVFDMNETNCDLEMAIFVSPSHDNCSQPIAINQMMYCNRGGTKNEPVSAPGSCSPRPPHNGGIFSIDNAIWFSFTVLPTDPQPYAITMENISCISGTKAMQMMVFNTSCDCAVSLNPCLLTCTAQSEPPSSDSLTIVPGVALTSDWSTPPGNYLLLIDGGNGADCTWGFDTTPLPLKFLSVTATKTEENITRLQWLIADEKKASHFEILKSQNGLSSFENIGSVYRNDTDGVASYSFTDAENSGYYKILMFDLNGNKSYSNVFSADLNNENFSIEPSLITSGYFRIKNNSDVDTETEIVITDQLGNILFLENNLSSKGLTQTDFSTNGWLSGMYFIQIRTRQQQKSMRIMVIN